MVDLYYRESFEIHYLATMANALGIIRMLRASSIFVNDVGFIGSRRLNYRLYRAVVTGRNMTCARSFVAMHTGAMVRDRHRAMAKRAISVQNESDVVLRFVLKNEWMLIPTSAQLEIWFFMFQVCAVFRRMTMTKSNVHFAYPHRTCSDTAETNASRSFLTGISRPRTEVRIFYKNTRSTNIFVRDLHAFLNER